MDATHGLIYMAGNLHKMAVRISKSFDITENIIHTSMSGFTPEIWIQISMTIHPVFKKNIMIKITTFSYLSPNIFNLHDDQHFKRISLMFHDCLRQ